MIQITKEGRKKERTSGHVLGMVIEITARQMRQDVDDRDDGIEERYNVLVSLVSRWNKPISKCSFDGEGNESSAHSSNRAPLWNNASPRLASDQEMKVIPVAYSVLIEFLQ